MTSVFLTTIWQSKEMNVGGIQRTDDATTASAWGKPATELIEKVEQPETFTKRKKAVSFHGVEPPKADDCLQWRLLLKRSCASTNVSILNLAEIDNDDSIESDAGEQLQPQKAVEEPMCRRVNQLPLPEAENSSDSELDSLINLEIVESSGLAHTKDSVTNLKRKTGKLNRNVRILQGECSVLGVNLEQRRQEAEDLEMYCVQLEESCRKVKKSVEEAETKTNALRQNSHFLEEKLKYLRLKVQNGNIMKREKEWDELEEKFSSGINKDSAEPPFDPLYEYQRLAQGSEDFRLRELHKAITVIVASIGSVQSLLEKGSLEARRETDSNMAKEVKAMAAELSGVRCCLVDLEKRFEKDSILHTDVRRMVAHVSGRFEKFLPQWERAQKEQAHVTQMIQALQANTVDISYSTKRIYLALRQLRTDMDSLSNLKPLLEELSGLPKPKIKDQESSMPGFSRYTSQALVSTEDLKHMLDLAMAPVVEELKNLSQPTPCPSCQQMQKNIPAP